jgi:DnaK suppressor protein
MMGKRASETRSKTASARKAKPAWSKPPAASRAKKALPRGKPGAKPAARKPRAPVARGGKVAAKTAARAKRPAPAKPAAKAAAAGTERRSRAVEKLMALKAEKNEKPAPKREGFLIKASKRSKHENLATAARFVRRPPTPVHSLVPAKPTGKPVKALLRKKDLDELHHALDAERQRLIAQMAALDETASLTGPSEVNENVPGYSIHLAEYASENQVVETTLAQRALQAERLTEIEEALRKIDNPGYGLCQNCAKPIGLDRLKIKPSAQYCVPCRQLKEQGKI